MTSKDLNLIFLLLISSCLTPHLVSTIVETTYSWAGLQSVTSHSKYLRNLIRENLNSEESNFWKVTPRKGPLYNNDALWKTITDRHYNVERICPLWYYQERDIPPKQMEKRAIQSRGSCNSKRTAALFAKQWLCGHEHGQNVCLGAVIVSTLPGALSSSACIRVTNYIKTCF